jgi:dTDP-4-dehydrorhamnose 3,5-epimerase
MKVTELALEGLLLVEPRVFRDERGFFCETWSQPRYREAGIDCAFVQDNHSRSVKGTLRGMHFQTSPGQAKLVRVVRGRVFDVAVDLRPSSPTYGRWAGTWLDDDEHRQLFIPVGFAHGFYVASERADVTYKCSAVYSAETEAAFKWDDPDVAIEWPLEGPPLISARDEAAPSFAAVAQSST